MFAQDNQERPLQGLVVRAEGRADRKAIARLSAQAFAQQQHSSHNEPFIIDALRLSGQLTVSLVAADGSAIVGHVAISPVRISSGALGWYGLGPIAVAPDRQRQGIGSALMKAALAAAWAARGARPCHSR